MLRIAGQILKDCSTSKDGESYNFAKITGLIIMACFLGVSFYSYFIKGTPFDPAVWGGVLTGIYSAINASIRATHITEPDQ